MSQAKDPTIHPVELKLRSEILPYLVTAERLDKNWTWPPLHIYSLYSALAELGSALAGIGLGYPITVWLRDGKGADFKSVFAAGGWMAAGGLLILIGLKVYIKHNDLEKKSTLLKSCIKQCASFRHKLIQVVAKKKPMKDLVDIQSRLSDLIDQNIAEGSWIFVPFENNIESIVDKQCNTLVRDYRGHWLPLDPDDEE